MKGVLAVRFDVDSVTCIEKGIPELQRVADRLGIRFTFFVNMGYSFNWSHNVRHFLRRRARTRDRSAAQPGNERRSLPTTEKLGWDGVVKTVLLNPRLGERYRATFDVLHRDGHELGLHGGMDHVVWQRSLDDLTDGALERLFRPAFETFEARYGRPAGFACPGFRYNDRVLDLLDEEGFSYSSDMSGEEPFRPRSKSGGVHTHYQVPVNVIGKGNVPVIEQGLAHRRSREEIVSELVQAIEGREFALTYGHPYVEGRHAALLEEALRRVQEAHEIVTVGEYLRLWKARNG